MTQQIISLSQFKSTAAEMLRKLEKTHDHIILTQNGAATAVVQDIHSFENDKKALLMLKLMVQGEGDIAGGRLLEQDTVFKSLRKKLQESNEKISG